MPPKKKKVNAHTRRIKNSSRKRAALVKDIDVGVPMDSFRLMPLDDVDEAPHGFPDPTILVQHPITDADITGFRRIKDSPKDCVINALQLMRIITPKTGNLLRITAVGKTCGITESEIAKIFTLYKGHNYLFAETPSYEAFAAMIDSNLLPKHVCFAGYIHATGSHVVVIGRQANGTLVLIDPQADLYCNLATPACEAHIQGMRSYFLLFRSKETLTAAQISTLGEGFDVEDD